MSVVEQWNERDFPGGLDFVYRSGRTVRLVEDDVIHTRSAGIRHPEDRVKIDYRPEWSPRLRVRLTAATRAKIGEVVRHAAPYRVETGGWLYSPYRPRARGVEIVHATDSGPNGKHTRHSVKLSSEEEVDSEFSDVLLRAIDNGMRRVGDFHSHPSGSPEPSARDRKGSAFDLLRGGQHEHVGSSSRRARRAPTTPRLRHHSGRSLGRGRQVSGSSGA